MGCCFLSFANDSVLHVPFSIFDFYRRVQRYRRTKTPFTRISCIDYDSLVVLAALAALGGAMGMPEFLGFHHWLKGFLAPVFVANPHAAEHGLSHSTEIGLMAGAFIGAVVSIAYAYYKYVAQKQLPDEEGSVTGLGKVIYHKYYVDEIYNTIVVKPIMFLSEIFHDVVDRTFVDGGVNLTGKVTMLLGNQVRKIQSGYIGFYLLMMVLSIVAIFVFVFFIH
jgi:NADH-quinone oxidoreductase subunit L